jgi:hypothetical protein
MKVSINILKHLVEDYFLQTSCKILVNAASIIFYLMIIVVNVVV